MNSCARCKILPARRVQEGTLYLAPPIAHTQAQIRELLRGEQFTYSEPVPNILTVSLTSGGLEGLIKSLAGRLSKAELRDTRCVMLDEGAELTVADLAHMEPLGTLIARLRGEWLMEILREDRLATVFQPIVHAGAPHHLFAYECLLRGRSADGSLLAPTPMYEVARDADLLYHLDLASRLTAIRSAIACGLGGDSHLFINFNPTSIYDPAFCLRSTIAAICAGSLNPERIVFEVVESDEVEDIPNLLRIIDFYRNAGFRIALDDLGSGYASLNLLGLLKPDYVKLDMKLIRDVDRNPYQASITRKLLEMARDLGVASIAEGIETEGELAWVVEHGADYVQGFLFARPENPPPLPRDLSSPWK